MSYAQHRITRLLSVSLLKPSTKTISSKYGGDLLLYTAVSKTSSGDGWQQPGRHLVLALNPVLIPSEAALIASRVYTHLGRKRVQFLFHERFEPSYL